MYIKEDNMMFLKNLITTELAEKMKNIGFRDRCFLYFYKTSPDIFHFELDETIAEIKILKKLKQF